MNDDTLTNVHPSATALLARADALLLLADLFRTPERAPWPKQPLPDADEIPPLIRAAAIGEECADLQSAFVDAVIEAARIDRAEVSREHHRLFEGAMPCPLNETAFVRRDKGAIIGDIAGFYRAFGFAPDAGSGEKADHLLCQLEFVAALMVMCAQAADPRHRRTAEDALRDFAVAHPADWVPAVCEHLGRLTRLPLFERVAAALSLLWGRLVRVHGWPVTPPTAAAPEMDSEEASAYECGDESPSLVTLGTPRHA